MLFVIFAIEDDETIIHTLHIDAAGILPDFLGPGEVESEP